VITTNRQWRAAIAAAFTAAIVVAIALVTTISGARSSQAAPVGSEVTASATTDPLPGVTPSAGATSAQPTTSPSAIKNVVMILADDLDWNTFSQVPRLNALRATGTTFVNHTVTDSLCCPSRSSILRSQYVHSHKVVSNTFASGGGFQKFYALGEEKDCLGTWLDDAGLYTGYIGKYLNEYPNGAPTPTYIPPGWDEWIVPIDFGKAYKGYDYRLNRNGKVKKYGSKPKDLINDVLTADAQRFIRTAPEGFYLQLATFAPHEPAPVAKRNRNLPGVSIPRTPSFNAVGTDEPAWLAARKELSITRIEKFDNMWRNRVRSAESVADSVTGVYTALAQSGHIDDTLVIVTSDNGFHAVFHRLPQGKRTAFKEDTVVPLIVMGPGVTTGGTVTAMTSTVDLAPTITSVLGTAPSVIAEGRNLVPFLTSQTAPSDWRTATLTESMSESAPGDPDYSTFSPPRFASLRSEQWLYVEYVTGERELYNRYTDPDEMRNLISKEDPSVIAQLSAQLSALRVCTGSTCRVADSMPVPSSKLLPEGGSEGPAGTSPSSSPSASPSP
jgi:arylsulfatase A-like enzyme